MNGNFHEPVLKNEVIDLLITNQKGIYVDCTLGGGGHFKGIASKLDSEALLIGIDRDPDAITWNKEHPTVGPKIIIEQNRFSQFDEVLKKNKIEKVNGILLDLGVSSHQIDTGERGFSYMREARLDMRMNPQEGIAADELIRRLNEEQLAKVLSEYGEVKNAFRMARTIKNWLKEHSLVTSSDLKACLKKEYGPNLQIKIVSKVFQALRIEVNDEMGELRRFLEKVVKYLTTGGRLAIISYHSLEDRMVKVFVRLQESKCICPVDSPVCTCTKPVLLNRVTKKAIEPGAKELEVNPRSRSAHLRVAERTDAAYE